MHRLIVVCFLLFQPVFWSCNNVPKANKQSVNALIGDISFIEKFDAKPHKDTDENTRIHTHLKYVESLLRAKDVSHLSPDLKSKRAEMLNLLREYRLAGIFPKNYDYPGERKPCFIDKNGRICAVGYLIEQSVGREVAESINEKYKYEEILAMSDTDVDEWIRSSGLTKEECAMIQPKYGYPSEVTITFYGLFSALSTGGNLTLSTVNTIQAVRGVDHRRHSITGLATGAWQIAIGALVYSKMTTIDHPNTKPMKNISLANIGFGSLAIAMGSWNLIANRSLKGKDMSFNIYGYPTIDQQFAFGVNFSRTF
ncbi:MAG: hypothetical protein WD334_05545 [Chitinophagales bacterium]